MSNLLKCPEPRAGIVKVMIPLRKAKTQQIFAVPRTEECRSRNCSHACLRQ